MTALLSMGRVVQGCIALHACLSRCLALGGVVTKRRLLTLCAVGWEVWL